jgi:DegV family protein with EDD domain
MGVTVVTDSTSYLPREALERLHIVVVPLFVNEGGATVPETEIDLSAFYRRLADTRVLPTTSQPSPEDFAGAFSGVAAGGSDTLGVLMSAKMSGALRAAEIGADLTRERHPEARIVLVDSESNCMQEGFAALAAAEVAGAGGDLDDCEAAARASIRRTRYLFVPRSLEYLSRGGRISKAAALLGIALKITPILTTASGTTGIAGKVLTHKKALARMASLMRDDIEEHGFGRVVVHAIADLEEAARFAREMIEPIAGCPVPVIPVGPVIGVHVGPAVGIVYETVDPLR